MNVSPMMQQYLDAKAACGDALLLFRMGDFYELFYEDAKQAANAVGLTLTSRDKGTNPIPMAGFPHHQLEGYLAKLIRMGFRVAICEQVEDPQQAKGLVRREVTRVVTPGTLTDEELLDPKESNYLAAVVWSSRAVEEKPSGRRSRQGEPQVGIAWAELSTGRFFSATVPARQLGDELTRIAPAECLMAEGQPHGLPEIGKTITITRRPAWVFGRDNALPALLKHFQVANLEGFGFDDGDQLGLQAAAGVLDYLQETQKASLEHIDRLTPYRVGTCLEIDQATRRSLELTRTIRDGARTGSLVSVLDRTVTAMGSRLLVEWLNSPLTDPLAIGQRLDAVEELSADSQFREALRTPLRGIYDMERLLTRVATGRATPRDLSFIASTLRLLPAIQAILAGRSAGRLSELSQLLDSCEDLERALSEALCDECPLLAREGGIIRPGYHPPLDQLRELASGGKEWIARYQAAEADRTGITNLKIGYNKVFGYFIEITNAQRDRVPIEYTRKQTLKNAERYVTPELKEYEEKVLTADEQAHEIEYELFVQLRDQVQQAGKRLRQTAYALAELDVYAGLGDLALHRGYCRPQLGNHSDLKIVDGRHPVLDITEPDGTFVPNDTIANAESGYVLLITGPNMAGKSTYIRQVALISLMAQMGSFVPAREAHIGIADRIFARVGASDELSRGQSTFMVEMTETARILNTATQRSLVILDEIGRGTSTYDGVSLAWSIVEYLHDQIGCRTLFATHYHELTALQNSLTGVANLNVEVKEWNGKVVFLHKIVPGAADKSYGIHVAELAGVPESVNERAKQILIHLEHEHGGGARQVSRPRANHIVRRPTQYQLTLFDPMDHPLFDELRQLQIEHLPPVHALQLLQKWQEQLARDGEDRTCRQ
ncbi:MAG: DNA mismatch repair protein MutS [Pirellulaceae bacterium]